MTAYANGVAFEQTTAKHLEDNGYFTIRAAGSHGPADIIAIKTGQVLLVQCKSGRRGLTHDAWNQLYRTAHQTSTIPLIADRPKRGTIRYQRIIGEHTERTHHWPVEPWTADYAIQARP